MSLVSSIISWMTTIWFCKTWLVRKWWYFIQQRIGPKMSQTKMSFTWFWKLESLFPSESWSYRTSSLFALGHYVLSFWLLIIWACWIKHTHYIHISPIKIRTPSISKFTLFAFTWPTPRIRAHHENTANLHQDVTRESHENCLHF